MLSVNEFWAPNYGGKLGSCNANVKPITIHKSQPKLTYNKCDVNSRRINLNCWRWKEFWQNVSFNTKPLVGANNEPATTIYASAAKDENWPSLTQQQHLNSPPKYFLNSHWLVLPCDWNAITCPRHELCLQAGGITFFPLLSALLGDARQ